MNERFDYMNQTSGLEYTINLSCGFYTTDFTEDFDLDLTFKQADSEMYINKKKRKKQGL